MAVISDNFESGVATQLELSELDDAALLQWVTNPEATEEYLRRKYGAERSLPPGVFDARHLPGKHNQKDHGHGHAAAGRVQGRDLTDELDYDAADQQVQDWALDGRYGDGALGHILSKQGFDGLPGSGSSEDIDRLVAEGHQELFRGWKDRPDHPAADMQEQFRTGRLDPGYGVFGNGVYAAPNRSEAELYGSTQRMALHKDAKVADYKSVIEEMSNRDDYDDSFSKSQVLQDPGRYAAAKGYDAIRYREEYEPGDVYEEVVVLNRTALTVQKGADLQNLRHLPGKHDQKTHGHGGGAAEGKAPLTSLQYDVLRPQPYSRNLAVGAELELDTFGSQAGRDIIKIADRHASSFSSCEEVAGDVWKVAKGKSTGDVDRDHQARTLLDAARHTPAKMIPPTLYRGIEVDDLDAFMASHRKGTKVEMSSSSFSSDRSVARNFAEPTKRKPLGFGAIVIEVDTSNGVQALPIQNLMRDPGQHALKEFIAMGEFEVLEDVTMHSSGRHHVLKLKQTGAF